MQTVAITAPESRKTISFIKSNISMRGDNLLALPLLPSSPVFSLFPSSLPSLCLPLFLLAVPQQLQCPTDRGLNDEQAQLQHRQQAESAPDQVGSKDKGEEGRGRREGCSGIQRPATTARTTRTTRSNIDSNKNNSCLPFVSEFHSLLPLLPLSSGSCTAAPRLRLLLPSLPCLLSPVCALSFILLVVAQRKFN